jgi:GWxTD domain-containing protein
MMMSKLNFLLISLISIAIIACSSYKNIQKENISDLYKPESLEINPVFKIWHSNDSITTVFYQVNLSELVYKKNVETGTHFAKYEIKYMLFPDYKAKELIDSSSKILYDSTYYNQDRSIIGFFEVPIKNNGDYILKLTLNDLHSKNQTTHIKEVEKKNKYSAQNFYVKALDGLPILNTYVNSDDEFRIIYNQKDVKKLKVDFIQTNYTAAAPPHLGANNQTVKLNADSTFEVNLYDGVSEMQIFKKQGIYHIYHDSAKHLGFTVKRFTSNYPYLITDMQTLMPLRYISTGKEFKKLIESEDKELAIYEFWKEILGGAENIKEVSNHYYFRVQQANLLFASDREGWKTDRGMIYIVYGAPDFVYRNSYTETWVYSDKNISVSETFNFDKSNNPFTDNDYWLVRSPKYIYTWTESVEFWRR